MIIVAGYGVQVGLIGLDAQVAPFVPSDDPSAIHLIALAQQLFVITVGAFHAKRLIFEGLVPDIERAQSGFFCNGQQVLESIHGIWLPRMFSLGAVYAVSGSNEVTR